MSTRAGSLLLIVLLFMMAARATAQVPEGQTVTWADFGQIRYVTSSISHTYFATSRGILRYNKLEKRWEEPLTGGGRIDDSDVHRIWVDQFDEKLYIETTGGIIEHDLSFNDWYPVAELPDLLNDGRHISPPRVMFPPFGYNYSGDAIIDQYGRDFLISDILDDGSGVYWIGTWGYGPAILIDDGRKGNGSGTRRPDSYLGRLRPYPLGYKLHQSYLLCHFARHPALQ